MEWIYTCLQLVLSEIIDFSAFLCYNQIKESVRQFQMRLASVGKTIFQATPQPLSIWYLGKILSGR